MTAPLYIDISAFQPDNIDWPAYEKWAKSFDGVSRVAIRSSYGLGFVDEHFHEYRAGALAAGVDILILYHYGYPQFNNPIAEANWQHSLVGTIRSQDVLMLDYEEQVVQATANWAYQWLVQQEKNYGRAPTLYASDAYVRARLQDSRLTRFPLVLANWQFHPTERPPCPPPWNHYDYLQYTDAASNIPGVNASVDADIYLGVEHMANPGADPNFLNSYWNTGVQPSPDFTTGIAATWRQDVSNDLWRGSPLMHEGKIIWKGQEVPWQKFEGGFYTDEGGVHYWHSNS